MSYYNLGICHWYAGELDAAHSAFSRCVRACVRACVFGWWLVPLLPPPLPPLLLLLLRAQQHGYGASGRSCWEACSVPLTDPSPRPAPRPLRPPPLCRSVAMRPDYSDALAWKSRCEARLAGDKAATAASSAAPPGGGEAAGPAVTA